MSKYGRQPFMDRLQGAGYTLRRAAALIGVPYLHLRNAGYGYITGKAELREGLTALLHVPAEDLFTGPSLAQAPHYGAKGRRQMEEALNGFQLWLDGELVMRGHRDRLVLLTAEGSLGGREFHLYDASGRFVCEVRDGRMQAAVTGS